MSWDIYWTIIGQLVLGLVILALPVSAFVFFVGSALSQAVSKVERSQQEGGSFRKAATK